MEHNQYLNEILYLIEKAYTTKNIDKNHLDYIHLFVNDLESNNKSLHAVYKKMDDIVTNKLANDYITLFTTHFSLHPAVTESFKIKSTLSLKILANFLIFKLGLWPLILALVVVMGKFLASA